MAIKIRSSKSQKIDIFPKGLTYGFGLKMAIFPNFFLGNIIINININIKVRKMSIFRLFGLHVFIA